MRGTFQDGREFNIRSDSLRSGEGGLDAPTYNVKASAGACDLAEVKVSCSMRRGGFQEEAALQAGEPVV